MKKQIAIAIGLAVLSTGALASKARLQALGQDTFGSFFLDDARNVTMNPALLNMHKDFVTLEWGDTSNNQDAAATPKAEGGMFKASGNMIYGLYFGDESNTANGLRAITGTMAEQNNTSFYVAGDAGVQWGVKLTYHSFENEATDVKSDATRATIGINSGDIESFLAIGLTNKAENGAAEFEGKGSYQLGVTYNKNDIDYMLEVRTITVENAGGDEYTANFTRIGAAKAYKLNDKANVWTSAWYKMDNSTNDISATGDNKETYLPVSIALEVSAKEWLTLRGSVTNEIIGTTEVDNGDKKTRADTTVVAAGASLLFGDLTIDGMIGNTDNNTTVTESTSNGTLRTDALMSRVSMTYKF
ncbi:MAG: hypothetical protein ACJAS4_002411 [Bacteriovoracaceae bacterium]|jgi:hypothetical protein